MKNSKGFTLIELLLIAVIIGIIVAIAIPQLLNARRSAWENRCKLTLRALGTAQLAYFESTIEGTYATFEALMITTYMQVGYSRGNLIDNYSITLWDITPPEMSWGGLPDYGSTFTIIAIPRSQKNKLRTFGIKDDQTARVFIGRPEDFQNTTGLDNAKVWRPIR